MRYLKKGYTLGLVVLSVWAISCKLQTYLVRTAKRYGVTAKNKPTATGFEPARAMPIGFQVQHLNHSVTLSKPENFGVVHIYTEGINFFSTAPPYEDDAQSSAYRPWWVCIYVLMKPMIISSWAGGVHGPDYVFT